jgi:mannose-6-phosphate isomerase-like protein (cupin superfamily)
MEGRFMMTVSGDGEVAARSDGVVRRVVVGLDGDGRSTIESDEPVPVGAERQDYRFTSLWEIQTPVDNASDGHPVNEPTPSFMGGPGSIRVVSLALIPSPAGTGTRKPSVVDLAAAGAPVPEQALDMHRTPTIDALYVVRGQQRLVTETGSTIVNAGDLVIQQGTWHRWENMLDEPCEVIGFVIATTQKRD